MKGEAKAKERTRLHLEGVDDPDLSESVQLSMARGSCRSDSEMTMGLAAAGGGPEVVLTVITAKMSMRFELSSSMRKVGCCAARWRLLDTRQYGTLEIANSLKYSPEPKAWPFGGAVPWSE